MPDQTPLIVILEDDARRQSEMSAVVHECYPHANLIIFDDAHKAIAYFDDHYPDIVSLDNDLVSSVLGHDPGEGIDVVEHIILGDKRYPVIIHTSNGRAGEKMESKMIEMGWVCHWTVPDNDLEWIRLNWRRWLLKFLPNKN